MDAYRISVTHQKSQNGGKMWQISNIWPLMCNILCLSCLSKTYLSSKKPFQLQMKQIFLITTTVHLFELRYVTEMWQASNVWNLKWNVGCLSHLNVTFLRSKRDFDYWWFKYILDSATIRLFGAKIRVAEMWQMSNFWNLKWNIGCLMHLSNTSKNQDGGKMWQVSKIWKLKWNISQ